jgi:hypothetical protein
MAMDAGRNRQKICQLQRLRSLRTFQNLEAMIDEGCTRNPSFMYD